MFELGVPGDQPGGSNIQNNQVLCGDIYYIYIYSRRVPTVQTLDFREDREVLPLTRRRGVLEINTSEED